MQDMKRGKMANIKFLVKVNRVGSRAPEYILKLDRDPIQMTPNRKRALAMGRFTAEDAMKSVSNSRRTAELVMVNG